MTDLFDIYYGEQNPSCDGKYYITLQKECTVREFIEEWMKDEREWGEFVIRCNNVPINRCLYGLDTEGFPECKFSHGKIVSEPFPDSILDSIVKKVYGHGGWSYSRIVFDLEDPNKIKMRLKEVLWLKVKPGELVLIREDGVQIGCTMADDENLFIKSLNPELLEREVDSYYEIQKGWTTKDVVVVNVFRKGWSKNE